MVCWVQVCTMARPRTDLKQTTAFIQRSQIFFPFKLANGQFIESGIQAYTGKYTVTPDQVSTNVGVQDDYLDQIAAATLVIYPQPLGLQVEYNIGEGPEYSPETKAIEVQPIKGGYAQLMYMLRTGNQTITPFVKVQSYDGGKKHERDAPGYEVYETEIGTE